MEKAYHILAGLTELLIFAAGGIALVLAAGMII
jgi:hypothetical protein